jgi:hypothetical protein
MKTIFIIGTYPTNDEQYDVLRKCIESIKKRGHDVMVVSHNPISTWGIYNLVDYGIYDRDNSFLPSYMTPHFWTVTDKFHIQIFNGGHTLPICRNMKNGVELAKARGYDAFVFMESDIIMSEIDMETLESYIESIANDGKEMFFFRPEEYRGTNNSYVYETLLFGGKLQFFIDNMNLPTNLDEWHKYQMGFTLEQTFYEKLCQHEKKFLIINDHSSNVFLDSQVNLFRYGLFNCKMIYNEVCPDEPVLFINNSFLDEKPKYVCINVDGKKTQFVLQKGEHWFGSYKIGKDVSVDVDVYEDDKMTNSYFYEYYSIKEENILKFRENGIIKLK